MTIFCWFDLAFIVFVSLKSAYIFQFDFVLLLATVHGLWILRFPQDFCSVLSRLLDNVYDFQGDFEKHNESVYIFSHVCLYITDTEKKGSFGLLS